MNTLNIMLNHLSIISFIVALFAFCVFGYWFLLRHPQIQLLRKKNETGERFAVQTKPLLGGVFFFVSVVCTFVFCAIQNIYLGVTSDYIFLICSVIAFGMGCVDDLKGYSPLFKLFFQCACAVLLICSGTEIHISQNEWINHVLTIFWVVGIMNSINMLDNMDGVSASISLIIFATIAAISQGSDFVILLGIIASLAAFLIWNWSPSKMYMGDNGSQLLGLLLTYFSIKYVWNIETDSWFNPILLVLLMFFVLLCDTTIVAINRMLGGRSPFVGDRFHTTHCLVYSGFTITQTVLILDVIAIVGCIVSGYFICNQVVSLPVIAILIAVCVMVILFVIAYRMNFLKRKENNLLFHQKTSI